MVVTFWPHPATYFKRAPLAYALTTPEEREALIVKLGVDEVVTLPFNQELANLSAKAFLRKLMAEHTMTGLVVGPNFALGKEREGSTEKIAELSPQLGFTFKVVKPLTNGEGMISSSQIRKDLTESRVREAATKLGRPYRLSGKVVHGEHRGTGLGFPTANLDYPPERLIPANGVYATRAIIHEKVYSAVTNIGVRPTFENPLTTPRVEPHILDTQGEFYGETLELEFIDFLRPEEKFHSPDELVAQIQRDITKTRKLLQNVS